MPAKPNIAELVETLPLTDRQIEAQKSAAAPQDPAKPAPKPGAEVVGSKFTGPAPAAAAKLCEAVLAGGRESLVELIELIRDPADLEFMNYKAEYLVHILAVHVGRAGRETQRSLFTGVLAAQAGNEKLAAPVRAFLVRELRLIGGADAVKALGNLLSDETLCEHAAAALVSIEDGAGESFRKALPKATGRNRLILVQSLGAIRDAKSALTLAKLLTDPDRDIRLAAAWGLARIGDPSFANLLIKTADSAEGLDRAKATQACLVLAETLASAGKKTDAAKIYSHLRDTRTDLKEAYICEAARQALTALAGQAF